MCTSLYRDADGTEWLLTLTAKTVLHMQLYYSSFPCQWSAPRDVSPLPIAANSLSIRLFLLALGDSSADKQEKEARKDTRRLGKTDVDGMAPMTRTCLSHLRFIIQKIVGCVTGRISTGMSFKNTAILMRVGYNTANMVTCSTACIVVINVFSMLMYVVALCNQTRP